MVFNGFRWVCMIIHGSRLVFHGSRLVFHASTWDFMVIHGSRLIFHGSNFASRGFSCFQAGFLGFRLFFFMIFMIILGPMLLFS